MSFAPFVVFALIGVIASIAVILYYKRAAQRANRVVKETKKNGRNWRYYSYIFLSRNRLTKKYFQSVRNRLQSIYPADDIAINLKATNICTRNIAIAIAMIIFTFIIARGDLFFIAAGFTTTFVLFRSFTRGSLESLETKLLHQLQDFIDEVREQYNECKRVDDAVGNIIDKLPYEIGLHADIIHRVLTSTRVEEAADRYIEISPNRFFMMFTAISATTQEYGDRFDEKGSSIFLKNLNFLKEEVNIELLKNQKNNALFTGLTGVSLAAIFAIKPIEWWAIGNVSEMASYYSGSYGLVCMVGIFLLSLACYILIGNLKDAKKNEVKEDSILRRLANREPFRSPIQFQINANYSKALRHDEMLRFTGDHLGINTFILKRYLFAFGTGIVAIFLFTAAVIKDRAEQLNDYVSAFESSMVPDEEYRQTMKEVAEAYAKDMKSATGSEIQSAQMQMELKQRIMDETSVKDEEMADLVAKEVAKHVTGYHNGYFRWWYLLVSILAGIIGYYIPLWNLIFQQKAVMMNMEDEVSQFQTITLILMHVDGMNVEKLLEWVERFAYCFKTSITECSINIPRNQQKALEKLQEAETFNLFQSYVGNLITVDKVGVERAFASLETDREYYKKKRETDNDIMVQRKSTIAKVISMAPLVATFTFYLIVPMLKMAFTMMNDISSAM